MGKEGTRDLVSATVQCACGQYVPDRTTKKTDVIKVEICSKCHPYFTGKQKLVDTGGRVDKFKKRYISTDKTEMQAHAVCIFIIARVSARRAGAHAHMRRAARGRSGRPDGEGETLSHSDRSESPKRKKEKAGKIVRRTYIGGQAVLEGVMMKGRTSMATAVRTESGEITVEAKRIKDASRRGVFFRCPS